MVEEFINPITLSFRLLESYRSLLKTALEKNKLSPAEIQTVLDTIQIDHGLFFSLNRKYKESELSFEKFCWQEGISELVYAKCFFEKILRLFIHQEKAIRSIRAGMATVVSTGTGSGKTETFLVPIIDHCLKQPEPGVKALIIYPMNALANDQLNRLAKAVESTSISFGVFVGSTPDNVEREVVESLGANHRAYRDDIRSDPPDILITNYVMLDWMLTRPKDLDIFTRSKQSLKYIVIDEIHTYRGNKATHLKFLLARLKANLEHEPVQIATSATLRRGKSGDGYLKAETKKQVNEFIEPLLNISDYELIEPEFEDLDQFDPLPIPKSVLDFQDELDWSMTPDRKEGLRLLGLLTDHRFTPFDLDDDGLPRIKYLLNRNVFIDRIKHDLCQGSQSFSDLVRTMAKCVASNKHLYSPENVVKAYLSAISFINNAEKDSENPVDIKPVMDFRIHLLLRNVTGCLKFCIKCHSYHSGGQEFCQACGFPLFFVYQKNVHKCIGKVSGNKLKWHLEKESDDRKNTYYVLMDVLHPDESEGLNFDQEMEVGPGELILEYDPYGKLRLSVLKGVTEQNVLDQVIRLNENLKDFEYLYNLVRAVLLKLSPREKKVLGFIDNREKATHYSMVIRDSFTQDFFLEFLKFQNPSERQLDLLKTLQYLEQFIQKIADLSELEQEVFQELKLWFYVFVKTPHPYRQLEDDFLVLKNPEKFSPQEQKIIEIFIRERVIDMVFPGEAPGKYIRFQTYHATNAKGIHINPEDGSDLKKHPSISLGAKAFKYGDVVDELWVDVIQEVIEKLVTKNVLSKGKTEDGKTHYYLLPTQVLLNIPESEYRSYRALKDDLLLTAGVHSSEIKAKDRKLIEEQFKENLLSFLLSTPTLELGIDIGQLQSVLMVGVPPMPSNYAQRAGRAGRDLKNHFALITTFCIEDSNHDSYYFLYPKRMIDGVISPPTFDPHNIDVLSKHFNAYLLSGLPLFRARLSTIIGNKENELIEKIKTAADIFKLNSAQVNDLLDKFKEGLSSELEVLGQRYLQRQFFSNGFFPDYAFRKDQVYVVPEGVFEKHHNLHDESALLFEDIAISEREPEMAYYKYSPGEIVFMAGDVYEITSKGKYEEITLDDGRVARSYVYIEASIMDGYASRDKIRMKTKTQQQFLAASKVEDENDVVVICYSPTTKIRFINAGVKQQEEVISYSEKGENFCLFYELERQALILRFDSNVCSKETYYLSLISALDRTIKDTYGLDEGEIKVLVGAKLMSDQKSDGLFRYVLLYDAAGWGNVPIKKINDEFNTILANAYEKLVSCSGSDEKGCETGCYACLKSYGLHYYAHLVDKEIAKMFIGYLLGKNKFLPSISPITGEQVDYDLSFDLNLKGQNIEITTQVDTYNEKVESNQNKSIFELLTRVIQIEFKEGMEKLLIRSNVDYIVNAINKGEIKKDKEEFALLQFNLLRFKHYKAEKI